MSVFREVYAKVVQSCIVNNPLRGAFIRENKSMDGSKLAFQTVWVEVAHCTSTADQEIE